jgi:hypothetical protein
VKYNRLRATPWLGATPPFQQPYSGNLGGGSSSPYVARCLLCTALCNRARPLAHATPATDEEVSARRTHDLWRRAAHLHARSKLLLAHLAAACPHHFSADSLFHGLPMCSIFRSKPESHKPDKKFVSSLGPEGQWATFGRLGAHLHNPPGATLGLADF